MADSPCYTLTITSKHQTIMQKILVTMMAFALTIAAQAQTETVDTAQFVAVYDYECRTQDDEGQNVTDKMQAVCGCV